MCSKKIIFLAIVLFVAVAGCINSNNNYTLKEGILTVGVYPHMHPMTYMEDGTLTGYEIDMISEMAKKMNLDVEYKILKFDELIPAVENNEVDCAIAGIGITLDRKEKIEFSRPYRSTLVVVAVLRDSDISKITDLKGNRVGVIEGTIMESKAREIAKTSPFEVVTYDTPEEMYADLNSKKISATISDLDLVLYSNENTNIKVLDETIDIIYMGIAVNKNNEILLDKINYVMLEMEKEGYYEYLTDAWIR